MVCVCVCVCVCVRVGGAGARMEAVTTDIAKYCQERALSE